MGWLALADVARIVLEETVECAPPTSGPYARERVLCLEVERTGGTRETWYALTAGYFEGYAYELYGSREKLEAAAPLR